MPSAWVRARTVIEEPAAAIAADQYRAQFPRFDEAYDALKWLLARSCNKLGLHRRVGATDYRLYRQASDTVAKTPSLIVVYSYTDDAVTVDGLKAEPPYGP